MVERTNEAFELDEKLTVGGPKLEVGQVAPSFVLDHFDGNAVSAVNLSDLDGRVILVNTINAIYTPVCDCETQKWQDFSQNLPAGVEILTVSMDLPFAQHHWAQDKGILHRIVSAHKDRQFGHDFGVLLCEWRMLQRAVFVIGRDGRIVHCEYVADQMEQPNYDAAIEAAREAAA